MSNQPDKKGNTPMTKAVADLSQFPEDRVFDELSDGIRHIVANATDLNEAARKLSRSEHDRVSNILRGMAEEEAAKVLILIDAIRCPSKNRKSTLNWFNNHLAKRIYATISSYPNIFTFEELRKFINLQRQRQFLDGPNDVDWIVRNEILWEREQKIYVDFIRDTTELPSQYFWSVPVESSRSAYKYESPNTLTLVRALADAGASSPDGLAIIADVWRDFAPTTGTDRTDVQNLIERMLNDLIRRGIATGDQTSMNFIYSHWSFPLWPLDLSLDSDCASVDELRKGREKFIRQWEATAAERNPPPIITRETVEDMHKAYVAWDQKAKERDQQMYPHRQRGGARPLTEFAARYDVPSYPHLKAKLGELHTDERTALLALANFARARTPNWPNEIKHATRTIGTLSDAYQVSLGKFWLPGLERWEAKPPQFRVGELHHY